jgi:hypothetical protein
MIEFLAPFVCQIYSGLTTSITSFLEEGWREAEIHPEMKEKFSRLSCLIAIEQHKDVLDDPDLQMRAWSLRQMLANKEAFTGEMLARELQGILRQVMFCVSRHKFAYIPTPNDQYFEQEQLFGGSVYALFPEARGDIKDAGNCIAAELYTAAVFHLMRASEYGLRALARKTRVKLTHKGKRQPLDTATWEKVIAATKSKLNSAHSMKFGPKRAERIRYYADLADRCSYVKDIWRNDTMHARGSYLKHDALAALDRVSGFMQILAGI